MWNNNALRYRNGRYRVLHFFATQLAQHLSSESFESAFCILNSIRRGGLVSKGFRTFALGNDGRKRRGISLSKLWSLRKVLKDFRPDIVLCHGSSSLKYGALSRRLSKRAVAIYRNIGMASHWSSDPLKATLNRMLLRSFDKIVSLSSATCQDFLRLYSLHQEHVVIIPNGVEVSPFEELRNRECRDRSRRKLGLAELDTVMITVGSLSPEKNQEELLTLVHDIRREVGQLRLLIVGDGPLRTHLEERAIRHQVTHQVSFLGVRDDVPELLIASDLFVLPSKTEAMPAALIEAGLAGLPSVAYDVGAVTEVVEDGVTGFVAQEGDLEAFTHAISKLIGDRSLRESMGVAARARCVELFSMERVAGMYERLFLALLNSGTMDANGTTQEGLLAH
jgi:glycosyltransferase involved in cell wall biosynthesis